MTSKEVFQQNDNDTKFLLAVVNNPAFERALVYAKQSWMEDEKSRQADPIGAVNAFLAVLRDLPIDEGTVSDMPTPKLHHDLDVPKRLPKTQKKKDSK